VVETLLKKKEKYEIIPSLKKITITTNGVCPARNLKI